MLSEERIREILNGEKHYYTEQESEYMTAYWEGYSNALRRVLQMEPEDLP